MSIRKKIQNTVFKRDFLKVFIRNPMRRQCQFTVKQVLVSPKCAVRDAMNYLSWSSSLATPLWRTKTKYIITAKTTAATNSGHIITTTSQRSAKNNSNRFGIANR